MKKLALILCVGLSIKAMAQDNAQKQPMVFNYVEQMPTSSVDINKYIAENVVYPHSAKANDIQGKVIVKFVVDSLGKIEDLYVVKSVDPSLDSEVVRVIRSMPDWKPGHQNGKAVNTFITLPIAFQLTDPDPAPKH